MKAPAEVTFEYADADVSVRKTFSFDHTYVVHVETSVVSKGSQVTAFPMWPAGFGDQSSLSSYAASRIEHQYNDKTERLDIKKISGGATLQGPFNWAGVVDQYFAAVFLPEDIQNAAMVTLRHQVDVPKDAKNPKPAGNDQGRCSGSRRRQSSRAQRRTPVRRTQITRCSGIRGRADHDRRAAGLARPDQLWFLWRDRASAVPVAQMDLRMGP